MRASIVGAGVSGLTCGVALQAAGWEVRIVAQERFEACVSAVAAAVWTSTTLEPAERTRRWALAGREEFATLAGDPATGVRRLVQRELERVDPGPTFWENTPYVRRMAAAELPAGYEAGFEVDGFIVEPPIYLTWLTSRFEGAGGVIETATVEDLGEVSGDLVVNCSGLGAARLAADPTVVPIRGQVVAVRNPGIRDGVADESDGDRISYVYPRSTEVILGGTREPGRSDLAADPSTTERILRDAAVLDPRVGGLEVVGSRVGLRPGRPTVRVEREVLPDGRPVVHDYGHSGAGFILSWGCAAEVVELAGSPSGPTR